MFCNQCEQTAQGTGCTVRGVCGKSPEVAALQDLIVYATRGLAAWAHAGRGVGVVDEAADRFAHSALFSTITNVDFDPERLARIVDSAAEHLGRVRGLVEAVGTTPATDDPAARFEPADTLEGRIAQGEEVGHFEDRERDDDIRALQMTAVYGLKGIAAYADHARILGHEDTEVYAFTHRLLASIMDRSLTLDDWVALVLATGAANLCAMELLDAANTGTYGHPVPTEVPLGHRAGKAILVSGHDLHDLASLLEQTVGKDILVYTHGEMLPAHGYPELKRHEHFYGHYGTAWQNQRTQFAEFPGAILMTTNCIQAPKESYAENIFTTGLVEWPGATHVENGQWGPVIERALELPGFDSDEDAGSVMVGFGRNAVLGVAPAVIDAVKSGDIRHFFLVGGCDGAKPGRSYYTDFVEQAPADTVVLTLACGKFRFFDRDLGAIGGIPRLLDIGQCNDAYSAVQIAVALADAFEVDVNELPLSIVLSWYEQKAVAVLLSLLHLGIKDIRLGPSMPAFVTPNVLKVLVDNFGIMPIADDAAKDLDTILGPAA